MPAKEPIPDNSLLAKMKAIEARAIERSRQRRSQESLPFPPEAKAEPAIPEPTAQLIEFPQWPEDRRATAQAVFRSALFPAVSFKGGRPFLKEERLCSVEGVEVFFTGERFDQSDLDVYLELLKIARKTPFGTECRFSAYSLLKALGRQTGNKDHKWLHSVIVRLRSGTVDMTDHQMRYFGGLVDGGTKEEDSRHYKVRINTDFACFFKAGLWASLDNRQRCALGRNQTAKALHAYYSTHVAPGPHTFEKLAGLIGLGNKKRRDVRANLIEAHDELKRIGFLSGYEVREDTVKSVINHTSSQNRHLVRKIVKARRVRCPKDTG
jgi:hypothetical protein